jgi:ketosteroid isomerase-like protein
MRYSGNQAFGRQCPSTGLSGRAAAVAASLRVPAGKGRTTAPPDPHSIGPAEDMTSEVSARVREMVYAWERRNLAGAVDPYAEDAIIQFEDGRVLRGRAALVASLRPQQDWATPGVFAQGRTLGVRYERGSIMAPVGNTITEFREIRWQANGRPLRRTYSATWRNSGGLWEIVHERVSADKPVTGARIAWP